MQYESVDFEVSKRRSVNKCHREALAYVDEKRKEGYSTTLGPIYSTLDENGKTLGKQRLVGYTVYVYT